MPLYKFLGFLNIALVAVITSPLWLRLLNKWFFHSSNPGFAKLLKALRTLHKPLAFVLLASIVLHGYLALGAFRLHTGTLAGLAFVAAAILGLLFYLVRVAPNPKPRAQLPSGATSVNMPRRRVRGLLLAHRTLVAVAVVLVVIHLVSPWLLSG